MSTNERQRLTLEPMADDPEVGRWLAALERMRGMTNDDVHRVRRLAAYDVAPDWAIHHILQHEAEHRSHIAWLRDTYRVAVPHSAGTDRP